MDWKSIIGSVAPTVATGLFGPAGGLIASIAGRILLGSDKASPDEVKDYVLANQTPEVFAKLKEIEASTTTKLRELEVDLERIHANDRDSARQREASVRDWTPRVLAFVIVGGFLATVFCVLAGVVEGLKDPLTATLIGTLIGYVSAKADQVCSYFFGSTAGSQAKTDAMVKAAVR
jgi:ABC-type Fe3+-siderophore transport system permease subunit